MTCIKRLRKELTQLSAMKMSGGSQYEVSFEESDMTKVTALLKGPADTPYERGIFQLSINVPDTYPNHPPTVKFVTPMWHPNISSVTGIICLDILDRNWTPSMGLESTLNSLLVLLQDPEPDDPQDGVVANMMIEQVNMFYNTARFMTKEFAIPVPETPIEQKVTPEKKENKEEIEKEGDEEDEEEDDEEDEEESDIDEDEEVEEGEEDMVITDGEPVDLVVEDMDETEDKKDFSEFEAKITETMAKGVRGTRKEAIIYLINHRWISKKVEPKRGKRQNKKRP